MQRFSFTRPLTHMLATKLPRRCCPNSGLAVFSISSPIATFIHYTHSLHIHVYLRHTYTAVLLFFINIHSVHTCIYIHLHLYHDKYHAANIHPHMLSVYTSACMPIHAYRRQMSYWKTSCSILTYSFCLHTYIFVLFSCMYMLYMFTENVTLCTYT